MPYIGNTIRAADDYRLIDDISSSFNGSTTSFALQVAGSAPVPFPKSPQQVLISVNGVIQEPDPTGASGFNLVGTNIVFSSAPTNGHAFFGIIYATADYLNAGGNFPSGSLGAPSFTFIGDENTGLYRKSGGSVGFVSDATEIANFDSNGITISSGNLILGDSAGASSDRVVLGASSDLSIYHNGSDTLITNTTGDLEIINSGDDIFIQAQDDIRLKPQAGQAGVNVLGGGAVELHHSGNKKFETTSTGSTVTGTLTATTLAGTLSTAAQTNVTSLGTLTGLTLSGDMTFTGDSANIVFDKSDDALEFNDDAKATFGTGADTTLTHSGADFAITNTTGNLNILNNSADAVQIRHGSETMIKAISDGAVELYFDDSKKAETVTGGFTVTGTCTATTFSGSGASLTSLPSGQLTGALPAIDGSNLTGVGGTTINNNADNRLITGSGTANTLNGESTATYDASLLNITSTTQGLGLRLTNTSNEYTEIKFSAARTAAGSALGILTGRWNNTNDVAQIYFQSGDDTTNKDDGRISFLTQSESGSSGTRLRIEPAGQVLIGSTNGVSFSSTAADDLIVGSAANGKNDGITILSGSAQNGSICFADNDDDTAGLVGYVHNGDYLRFFAGSSLRARIDSDGLKFGSDSAAANALDDYEEGTFNATVVGGSSVTQIFDQTGRYTKIGNFVHIQALAQFSGVGNGATVFLSLPFNHVSSTALGGGVISFTNVAGLSGESCLTIVGQSGVNYVRVKNKSADPTISGTQSNKAIYYHFAYQTA